jgi:hypothetical protein
MITTPLLASSRPASTFRMVDLPQPEWPMMQTNSPLSMLKVDVLEHRQRLAAAHPTETPWRGIRS